MVHLKLFYLPDDWRQILQWGHCVCIVLDGDTCPSCVNSQRIEAAGLDWLTEYEKAILAGEAILL
jgi:hypothetical protein